MVSKIIVIGLALLGALLGALGCGLQVVDEPEVVVCEVAGDNYVCGDISFPIPTDGTDGQDGEDAQECVVTDFGNCYTIDCPDSSYTHCHEEDCHEDDDDNDNDDEDDKDKDKKDKKPKCNNGGGNGPEGCSPGNGNDDES